jgi:protein subunit release factor A
LEHFSKSNQQLEKLIKQQKNMDTYSGKQAVGVVVDVVTRWWSSTYSMCERLIHLQLALAAMAANNKLPDYILSNVTDWKILRHVHQFLKRFKNAQKLLEGEKHVTLSLLPIAIKSIRPALIKIVGAEGGGEAQNRVKHLAKIGCFPTSMSVGNQMKQVSI